MMDQTKCNCPVSMKYGEHYDGCPVAAVQLRARIAALEAALAAEREKRAHHQTMSEARLETITRLSQMCDAALARAEKAEAERDRLRDRIGYEQERANVFEKQMYKMAETMGLASPPPVIKLHGEEAVRAAQSVSKAALAAARADAVRGFAEWLDGEDGMPSDEPFSGDALRRYLARKEPTE